MIRIERLNDGPIIAPAMNARMCERERENINGPSLIRVPDWVENPLGRYYLYFAHHQGTYIRLAYADDVAGPYTVHDPGVLPMASTCFEGHIASPNVHIDEANQKLIMYFHGCPMRSELWQQPAMRAESTEGLNWGAFTEPLGESYFYAFQYEGYWYAIAKGGRLHRSRTGTEYFEARVQRIDNGEPGHGRHWAVHRMGTTLHCFFSRWNDTPERIMHATIDLSADWMDWKITEPTTLLTAERDWEGADCPIEPSQNGAIHRRAHELRDPSIYEEDGRVYMLYTVEGEHGIAIARLHFD